MATLARPVTSIPYEELRGLLHLPVVDEGGKQIGKVVRIFVDRKTRIAKHVEILKESGRLLRRMKVPASKLYFAGSKLILVEREGAPPPAPALAEGELAKVMEIVEQLKTIDRRLEKLDELLLEGRISEQTFKILYEEYRQKRKALESAANRYLAGLRRRLEELERQKESLANKLDLLKARHYLGEVSEDEYRRRSAELQAELDRVKREADAIRSVIERISGEVLVVVSEEVKIGVQQHAQPSVVRVETSEKCEAEEPAEEIKVETPEEAEGKQPAEDPLELLRRRLRSASLWYPQSGEQTAEH